MYDIYISHYLNAEETAIILTEEKLYSIPITQPERALIDPVVKTEMGKAGSFEFSIHPAHPFYNRLLQMMTVMRVSYGEKELFRGRVLTIDTNRMTGVRKVHLEGDLVFFMDSYIEGKPDTERPVQPVAVYLSQLLENHNAQMNGATESDYKKFYLGEVPGTYRTVTAEQQITVPNERFGNTSWRKTLDELNSLSNEYGGYFRTRRAVENGVVKYYLDWLESWFETGDSSVNAQPIEITRNLIDVNDTSEVENIFTVLIPIGSKEGKNIYIDGYNEQYHGHNKTLTVKQVHDYLVATGREAEMNKGFHGKADYESSITKHGIIYRTQEFGNEDTKEKLWNTAVKWILDNYHGSISNYNVSALDLHHVNEGEYRQLITGDRITIIYPDQSRHTAGFTPTVTRTLTIISCQHTLHDPKKNNYTIGIPSSLLSKAYSKKSSKKASKAGGAKNPQLPEEGDSDFDARIKDHERIVWRYIIDEQHNNDKYLELKTQNPLAAEKAVEFAYATMLRGLTAAEDPTGQYSKEWENKVESIRLDPNKGVLQILGERAPAAHQQAQQFADTVNNMAEILVYDIVHNKMTVKEKLDFKKGPLTDEALTNYILHYGENNNKKKDVLTFTSGTISLKDKLLNNLGLKGFQITPGTPTALDPLGALDSTSVVSTDMETGLGQFNSLLSGVGIGTEDKILPTIQQVGDLSKFFMFSPDKAGSTSDDDKNVEMDGGGENGGELGIGKKDDGAGGKRWTITMNKNLKWYEPNPSDPDHPIEHTVPAGTVGAEDYYLESVPSFHTEFAYINNILADYIVTKDLVVENEAFINKLTSPSAQIDRINADKIWGKTWVSAGSYFSAPSYRLTGVGDEGEDIAYLQNCLSDVLISASEGKISFTFYKIGGGSLPEKNFNIADTQFYKDAVSAAKASVMPTAIAWNGTDSYFESHNPHNRDNSVKEEVQLVCNTSETGSPVIYYASMQSRVYQSETPWNNRVRKALAIVDVADDNNSVKLKFGGQDSGYTYSHNKYTAGYNSAHLSVGSWGTGADSNVWTVEKTDSTSENSRSLTLSANATISYDQNTHKYTATARAYGNGHEAASDTEISGTEAYEAGQTAAGLVINGKSIDRALSSSTKSLSISADVQISYDSTTHTYLATAQSKAGTTQMDTDEATSGTEAYVQGVVDGRIGYAKEPLSLRGDWVNNSNNYGYTIQANGVDTQYVGTINGPWFFYTNQRGSENWMLSRSSGPYIKISSSSTGAAMNDTTWEIPDSSSTHNIDIPSTEIYTSDRLPSGSVTKLTTLKNRYEQAKEDGDYVIFKVTCGGSSKTYYMEP